MSSPGLWSARPCAHQRPAPLGAAGGLARRPAPLLVLGPQVPAACWAAAATACTQRQCLLTRSSLPASSKCPLQVVSLIAQRPCWCWALRCQLHARRLLQQPARRGSISRCAM